MLLKSRVLALCPALLIVGVAAPEPSAQVALTPALAKWKSEIEAIDGSRAVVLVRVLTDKEQNLLRLPADAGKRSAVAKILRNEEFVRQFIQAHALTANLETPEQRLSVVLLNMARAEEWAGHEDALIAHEFGHIWLHARGYPLPSLENTPGCQALHGGDIVQHILIRDELRSRSIDFLTPWLRNLEGALKAMKGQAGLNAQVSDSCRRLSRLALWMDVELGVTAEEWPRREEFLAQMAQSFPDLRPVVRELAEFLQGLAVDNRQDYRLALRRTLSTVRELEGEIQ